MTITEVQLSTKERFDIAMREIRSAGVVARRNIMTCCRSCYDAGVAETQPIIWHYGGQGQRLDFNEDLTGAAGLLQPRQPSGRRWHTNPAGQSCR